MIWEREDLNRLNKMKGLELLSVLYDLKEMRKRM